MRKIYSVDTLQERAVCVAESASGVRELLSLDSDLGITELGIAHENIRTMLSGDGIVLIDRP
jgi:hypothetical protein